MPPFPIDLSASLFSSVPRSVLPTSSSERRPESFNNDSMRPNLFSRPSIYLALFTQQVSANCSRKNTASRSQSIPFGGIPLLLDLRKDTFCLVVQAVRALGHLPIAFDFLLPAHVARLHPKGQRSLNRRVGRRESDFTLAILLRFTSLFSSVFPAAWSSENIGPGSEGGTGEPSGL